MSHIEVPPATMMQWQQLVNILVQLTSSVSAMINTGNRKELEILTSSNNDSNPFKKGERFEIFLDCGIYCEEVLRTDRSLTVSNALEDPYWSKSQEVEHGFLSYIGYPLHYPDGKVYGTLCLVDNKPRDFDELFVKTMEQFKSLIESHLALIVRNAELEKHLKDIHNLTSMLPVCSNCRRIRDDDEWEHLDQYMMKHSELEFSHTSCEACTKELYPDIYEKLVKSGKLAG